MNVSCVSTISSTMISSYIMTAHTTDVDWMSTIIREMFGTATAVFVYNVSHDSVWRSVGQCIIASRASELLMLSAHHKPADFSSNSRFTLLAWLSTPVWTDALFDRCKTASGNSLEQKLVKLFGLYIFHRFSRGSLQVTNVRKGLKRYESLFVNHINKSILTSRISFERGVSIIYPKIVSTTNTITDFASVFYIKNIETKFIIHFKIPFCLESI